MTEQLKLEIRGILRAGGVPGHEDAYCKTLDDAHACVAMYASATATTTDPGLAFEYTDEQKAHSANPPSRPPKFNPRDPLSSADYSPEHLERRLLDNEDARGQRPTTKPARKRKPASLTAAGGAVRAATDYIAKHATRPDGVTLRRWRGDWVSWIEDSNHYKSLSDEQIDRSLYRELGLARRQDVADVRHALIAVDDVLIDETELGSWIGAAPADARNPLDLAACPNGLIHLPSRKLIPASPRYFATTALGVAYNPKAQAASRWLAFLTALWGDDAESIGALQEWFGYLLTADTRQQKILLLVGAKRSGKGTIMRILSALIGYASVAAPTLASLGTNFGLWPLIGKTAAIIGDARLGGRSDIAQIVERLLSISGEDALTIDRKHRDPWTGRLSTRIAVVSNELPRFTDASDAIVSRMLILELSRSWYGQEDTELTDKLMAELPGILLWAIEGWHRLRQRGHFVQPATSKDTIEEMADLASPVGAWVRERCNVGGYGATLDCTDAYRDFEAWAKTNGHHVMSQNTFAKDLKATTQTKRIKVRRGNDLYNAYSGLELRR